MRKGFLGSLILLMAGAGVAAAQSFPTYRPAPAGWGPQPGAPFAPQGPAYPGWPGAQGVNYAVPYQGPPMMPRYAPPGYPPYPGYPAYPPQMAMRYPTAAQPPGPQFAQIPAPLPPGPPSGPPATAVATPPPSSGVLPQPVTKPGDGDDTAPQTPAVQAPVAGTPLLQGDPVGDGPACIATVPASVLSHEQHPPRVAPKGYCLYGNIEGLAWWTKRQQTPPLVSTGTLGSGGAILVGQTDFETQPRYGSRLTLGVWLDPQQHLGLEATAFWLPRNNATASVQSPGTTRFGNPFIDANTGAEAFNPIAIPGQITGFSNTTQSSELFGGELNLRRELCRTACFHLDLLTGLRYLDLRESTIISESSQFFPQGLAGITVSSSDRFRSHDQFYGGQIGSEAEFHHGRWFIDIWGKLALGANVEHVAINGTTVVTSGIGLNTVNAGGFYAQPSNSGSHNRTEMTVLPEVGVQMGCQLTSCLRASVGYSFLYIADVVRAGEQIDRTINLSQQNAGGLVGTARPAFLFNTSDYWVHGFNVGLEFRY